MDLLGYIAAVMIGISLGIIGGGGSILTVPVLVYIFGVDVVTATAYSLFIVGLTSLVGSVDNFRKNLVDYKMVLWFGIPSLIAVFCSRAFIVPSIPNEIFTVNEFVFTKSLFLMLLFAVLMVAAAISMIRSGKLTTPEIESSTPRKLGFVLIEGSVVGVLTGLVGAGGGFLIIPALVLISKLPMKKAVGTSLVIIAIKSLIGFFGDHGLENFDWTFLFTVSFFSILGIFIGGKLVSKIDGQKLKPVFGWFVLIMGVFIIIKELWAS
ncbi:MAG: sulfite exporter TauE/SafE family protein [Saprospiraceae bacterium]|nr:sulfite exporter TauE/SafE family protein [Saprospiraceae bacterium]MBK7811699.1 sulfite exporter TauE/SafE family protein [Saprospiraceae bacterium]